MQLKKIADFLSFTKTELTVITFLLGVFVFGLAVSYFRKETVGFKNYDYSLADSLFLFSGENDSSASGHEDTDYKRKVLDLSTAKAEKKVPLPAGSSIDLNKADLKELKKLPGIGEKTAQKIIELRDSIGSFKNVEEVLKVKGIGPAKFNKIRKYIFVEE